MNKVILMGRLTKDAEIKNTSNNKAVAQFTVAVDRKFKDAQGNKLTDFINCVAWGQTATFISTYFHKGNKIAVVGNIQTRKYDDNQGVTHYVTEVIVDEAEFVESASQQNTEPAPAPTQPQSNVAPAVQNAMNEPEFDDDLPFEV